MFPPPQRSEDAFVLARINYLKQRGYFMLQDGKWYLTEKGWRTLSAAAEQETKRPPPQTKQRIESELEQHYKGIALTAATLTKG